MTVGSGIGRLLVVGASSGIGRALSRRACGAGVRVAASARRAEALASLAGDLGGALVPLAHDVREPAACRAMVDEATAALGGLDGLAYCAGFAPLGPLEDTTAEEWSAVLETNVAGAAHVTAAALPHLTASGGTAAYLSSLTSTQPWPWLGAYSVSKAGLDALIAAWRTEHPEIRFVRVVVGPTLTGFADHWPADQLDLAMRRWSDEGYAPDGIQSPDDVAAAVLRALEPGRNVTDVTVSP